MATFNVDIPNRKTGDTQNFTLSADTAIEAVRAAYALADPNSNDDYYYTTESAGACMVKIL